MTAALTPRSTIAECELRPEQFSLIAELLYSHAGIRMKNGKERLVRSRLARQLRRLDLPDFDAYLAYLRRDSSGCEFDVMIEALTTNTTSFLREPAHFEYLRASVLPTLTGTARIWSAGCATGEEPYTLAMLVNECAPTMKAQRVDILATDICRRVLDVAEQGEYSADIVSQIPEAWRQRYWRPTNITADGGSATRYAANDSLRQLLRFERLNLMDAWPMTGGFDVILCRNVMIYFDKPTQEQLIQRFWALLRPGGHLLVGHSESLTGCSHRFRYIQPATYVK